MTSKYLMILLTAVIFIFIGLSSSFAQDAKIQKPEIAVETASGSTVACCSEDCNKEKCICADCSKEGGKCKANCECCENCKEVKCCKEGVKNSDETIKAGCDEAKKAGCGQAKKAGCGMMKR